MELSGPEKLTHPILSRVFRRLAQVCELRKAYLDPNLVPKSSEKHTQGCSRLLCDLCQVTVRLLELSSPGKLTRRSSVDFLALVQL